MAGGFDSGVNAPGGASFAPQPLSFAQFGQWAADDPYDQKLKAAKLQQIQQQITQGQGAELPRDAQGNIDFGAAAQILAKKGDFAGAVSLLQQQPAPLSPMLGGQQPGAPPPQGQPQGGPQPAAAPARPLPPPRANSPQGDSGQGTLTSMVTDRLPSQNQTTGETIMRIAQVMGVDPNADLTPGQQRRAQGLLQKYAPETTGINSDGSLPPSANAGTPAPQITRQPPPGAQPAGPGGQPPAPARPQPQAAPQPPQPAQPQQQPLVPQEPLPQGYTDPMKAVGDLRMAAARLAGDPRTGASQQAQAMNDWATRIEAGLKPVSVSTNTSLVDPRSGKPVFEGPGAAALRNSGESATALDASAENYRQTGKLPPNMGRGVQGTAESLRIRERAAELETEDGGNPADWSTRWQKFGAQTAGRRTLETRAAGLELAENEATSLLPRVREASAKVSRTQYPSINSLIEAAQKGTGGTDVIKLGIAVESLVPVYARVLKPTGQIAQGDMARAHDILDKAWSDGQIGAALDQMQVELKSARTALDKTLDQYGVKPKKTDNAPKSDAKVVKWERGPDGMPRPAQ
jgi:hypothetical protein